MSDQLPDMIQVLHFELPGIYACIELQRIIKIILLPSLQSIPSSPIHSVGIMNYAGESIHVIDLALLLKIPRNDKYNIDTPILVCEIGSRKIGFVVDKVLSLAAISKNEVQINDECMRSKSIFIGIVMVESKPSYLINENIIFEQVLQSNNSQGVEE